MPLAPLLVTAFLSRAYAGSITADAGGPYTVAAGASVTLSASGSTSIGSCTTAGLRYEWDTNGDGTYDTSASASSSTTFSAAAYDGPTSVTPTVRVTNTGCSNVSTDSATITINNTAPTISATSITTSTTEGTTQTMTVTYADVETADTHSIAWTFGDATTGSGASVTHAYADNGTYSVTVTVTDDDGGAVSSSSSVVVANVAPVMAAPSGTTSGAEGASFSRTCTASDVAADTASWSWTWGDGTTSTSVAGSTSTVSHAYADEGTGSYTVTCTASDEDGGSSSSAPSLTVTNAAPVASASGASTGSEGVLQTYTCSATDGGTADTLSYAWSFSDGTTGTGTSVSKTWADNGTYTATCTVTDNDGASGTDAVTTVVANVAPAISSASTSASGTEGSRLSFACSASDVAADTITYGWNFGDGSTSSSATTTHTYADDGAYTATCTVTDEDGGSSSSASSIAISNVAPTITSYTFPSSGAEGATLSWAASATDPGSETLTYAWAFGDGSLASGTSATHAYADNGSYTATLTVSDGDGGTDTESHTVTISNVAPAITSLTGDDAGVEGDTFAFAVAYTDGGTADTLSIVWDYGDGTTDTGVASVTHAFDDDGSYTVSVEVCDDDGGCDSDSMVVTVTNAAPVIDSFTGDTIGNEGDSYNFDCAADDAGLLDTLTYTLTFGDGTSASAASDSHTFADDGIYTVACTVEDDDGGSVTETLDVTVVNVAPAIGLATSSLSGDEGESFTYAASARDVAADTITYTWAFGDGTSATGNRVTHAYADDGRFTFTLTVSDEDGGSSSSSGRATVANVAPTVVVGGDTSGEEGAALSFTAGITDPGTADTYSCVWEWGDGDGDALSGTAATHIYADDGSYTLTLTCIDDDAGLGTDSVVVTVSDVPPTFTAFSADSAGDEGDVLSYVCSATDQGPADTVTIAWDFGDGSTGTGDSVTHAFATEGSYTVTCTATDDDGYASTQSIAVAIANVPPSIDTLAVDSIGNEGESLNFAGSASDPGTADVVTWTWDWGDGTTSTGESVTHAWGDNGVWTVLLSVSDGTDVTESAFDVTISNVAPTLLGTPGELTYTDEPYVFTPTLVDPGWLDTWTWSATLPSGASLDSLTGEVTWTPLLADAGTHAMELVVTDDDGDSFILDWPLDVIFLDEDGDGLADNWETAHGLDATDASDAAEGGDADGMTNAEEYAAGTDPAVYEGPSMPTLKSPADGDEVAAADVDLRVGNAASPRGEALGYGFEVYDDEDLTSFVTGVSGFAEDTSGETAWTVDVPLTENTWYWWRADASDSWVSSGWSGPSSFFYNTVNDPPTAPSINNPFDGSSVVSTQPTLVLDEASDPDEDALTYTVVVTDAGGTIVTSATGLVGDGLTASWTVDVTLTDGATWCWYATATDEDGLSGPDSDTACFAVDSSNLPPSDPEIVAPEDGGGINTDTVDIVVTNGVDPEGRGTLTIVQLDTDPAFGSAAKVEAVVSDDGSGTTTWTTPVLADDTWYYARALTSDGAAYSGWDSASFYVNLDNEAPAIPVLNAPNDAETVVSGTPLSLLNAADPDGDPVRYDLAVYDASGTWVDGGRVDEDTSGTTPWPTAALADGDYTWTARAVDDSQLASAWASERAMTIGVVDVDTDTGSGETDDTDNTKPAAKTGCGCAAPGGPAGGAWLLLGLAGLAVSRRRSPA